MPISGGLDTSILSSEDDENKSANLVGVILMSNRSVQLDKNRSRLESNIGQEIKDVRPILSCVTHIWHGRSKVGTEYQSALGALGRRKTKTTPRWITYQLEELVIKHSRLNMKVIRSQVLLETFCISLSI